MLIALLGAVVLFLSFFLTFFVLGLGVGIPQASYLFSLF